jgi:hypothetical protein
MRKAETLGASGVRLLWDMPRVLTCLFGEQTPASLLAPEEP